MGPEEELDKSIVPAYYEFSLSEALILDQLWNSDFKNCSNKISSLLTEIDVKKRMHSLFRQEKLFHILKQNASPK